MPGFSGTGPAGGGPMTGRGRGYCMSYAGRGINPGPWLGRGGGRGWRHWCHATGMPRWARRAPGPFTSGSMYAPPADGEQELDLLRERVGSLESALEQAKKRINELEGKKEG
ncbi:MAG: DUF5320 domain-containing protein [Bacillota bacterium]